MSLVLCPECSHEVSLDAVACPNCGFPMAATPVVEERTVVMPPPKRKNDSIPMWAWVPVGVLALIVVFLFIFMLSGSSDEGNVNLSVNARRPATTDSRDVRTETVPATTSGQTVTVPSSDTTVSVPSAPATTTTVPSSDLPPVTAPAPTRGKVVINAKVIAPRASQPNAARGAKFYLLDKDIETILSDADVEPIEGNTLAASLGLAAVYPDRYGEFMRAAMRAIARHSKYSGTTDTAGQASLGNITPGEYYLYGLTRIGRGFALWNAPVSVTAGDNLLNLSPQSVTEIPDTTG
jgi:hypothetical protein